MHTCIVIYTCSCLFGDQFKQINKIAFVAEWSKAVDSSSILFGGVGSNPTGCMQYLIIFIIYSIYMHTCIV